VGLRVGLLISKTREDTKNVYFASFVWLWKAVPYPDIQPLTTRVWRCCQRKYWAQRQTNLAGYYVTIASYDGLGAHGIRNKRIQEDGGSLENKFR